MFYWVINQLKHKSISLKWRNCICGRISRASEVTVVSEQFWNNDSIRFRRVNKQTITNLCFSIVHIELEDIFMGQNFCSSEFCRKFFFLMGRNCLIFIFLSDAFTSRIKSSISLKQFHLEFHIWCNIFMINGFRFFHCRKSRQTCKFLVQFSSKLNQT